MSYVTTTQVSESPTCTNHQRTPASAPGLCRECSCATTPPVLLTGADRGALRVSSFLFSSLPSLPSVSHLRISRRRPAGRNCRRCFGAPSSPAIMVDAAPSWSTRRHHGRRGAIMVIVAHDRRASACRRHRVVIRSCCARSRPNSAPASAARAPPRLWPRRPRRPPRRAVGLRGKGREGGKGGREEEGGGLRCAGAQVMGHEEARRRPWGRPWGRPLALGP